MITPRCFWFRAALILFFFQGFSAALVAQSTPTGIDPAAASPEALIQQTGQAVAALEAITQRLSELRAQEAELSTRLTDNARERQALAIPEPPVMTEFPTDSTAAEALLETWDARLAALEQRRSLNESRRALAQEHRDIALVLSDETRLAGEARNNLAPRLETLARRVETGEIDPADLPEPVVAALDGAAGADTAPATPEDWSAAAARDAVLIQETNAALAESNELIAATTRGQRRATRWLQEVNRRQQLRQEFQARESADLLARLNTELGEWQNALTTLEERRELLSATEAELETRREALEAIAPPSPDTVAPGTATIESLRLAQEALALAEANLAYRDNRLEELQRIQSEATALVEQRQAFHEALNESLDEGIELAVIGRLLADRAAESRQTMDLPNTVGDGSLDREIDRLRRLSIGLNEAQAEVEAALAALDEAVETAASARQEAQASLDNAQTALAREESWVSFIREVETLDNDALLQAFADTLASLADTLAIETEVQEGVAQIQAQADTAREAYRNNFDPVVVSASERTGAFTEWYQGQGLDLLADPEARDTGAQDEAATDETTAAPAAPAASAEPTAEAAPAPSNAERWLAATRNRRDQQVLRRLNYYQDNGELRIQLLNVLTNLEYQLEQQRQTAAEALELARRAWGSATALNTRVQRGELDAGQLPAEIAEWENRDQVVALRDRVDDLSQQVAAVVAERDGLAGTGARGYQAPLDAWATNLTEQAEQLSDYLGLVEQFNAIESREELGELEARMLEREIVERIRADLGVYDALDNFFATSETETLDELLRRYYERLILLERRVANLDSREEVLTVLTELVETSRDYRRELLEAIGVTLEEAEAALDARTTAVKVALDPGNAATLLAAFEERSGAPLDPDLIPTLPADGDEAALREDHNALVMSLQQPWSRLAGYRTWQTSLREDLAELGNVDERISEIRNHIAELDAERLDYQRRITRLAGYSEAELQTLTTDGGEFAGDTLGEIDRLQIERRQAVNWRAVESTGLLILIPIIALLAILFARRAGRKLVDRMVRLDDKDASDRERAERELRATTLMDIFGTIWNIIIIALAVIYMLKVVNIDVTPILASLGIFGLAVAFGAQAIMKDLFTGFFLLLENQMNRGEWVTVNGNAGQVESIGLRITRIRDFLNGSLHYIPNGQIDVVQSWSRGLGKDRIFVSVPLTEDHHRVQEILAKLMAELKADPDMGHTVKDSYISNGIKSFDMVTGAMTFEVWMVFTEGNWASGRLYRQRLKETFEAEGIPFALPQHQIHMKSTPGDTPRPQREDLTPEAAD